MRGDLDDTRLAVPRTVESAPARALSALCAWSGLLVLLSGCQLEGAASDAMQLRIVDAEVELRLCAPMDVTSIVVESRGEAWRTVFEAEGLASLTASDIISPSTIGAYFESFESNDGPVGLGDDVTAVVSGPDGKRFAEFEIEPAAASGAWQNPVDETEAQATC